jgi:D-serine deaminase-like pyridoxal phosphate-dependent protein
MDMHIDELPTPALVVDLDRLERNIAAMATRADRLGVALRPHVKTHKCVEIGLMQQAAGCQGITVSTLEEAHAFAGAGFDDIIWAFPIGPSRVPEAADLANRVRFGVVVDSPEAVDWLRAHPAPYQVWIKVDCGYHRAGAAPSLDVVKPIVDSLGDAGLHLAGLLSHSGNAYDAGTAESRQAIAEAEGKTLAALADELRATGCEVPGVSTGSTPGCTAATALPGVTEIRPGNYAYFDRFQVELGSCAIADVAVSVISTAVSRAADHSVCDAGALVMSKDLGPEDGSMGEIWSDYAGNELHRDLRLVALSQEHAKLSRPVPQGTRLRIMPNHSCLTAACFANVWAVRGTAVVDRWRVWNAR